MTKVSFIILSWNRKEDSIETIRSLSKSVTRGFFIEIVVVDNGSDDGSQKEIGEVLEKINKSKNIDTKFIELSENLGFCKGNNTGIKYAFENKSDYIVLLNDDVVVDKNMTLQLIKAAIKDKKTGVLSPKIYFAPGYEFHKKRYKKSEKGKVIWYAGGDIDWNNIYGLNHGVDEVDKGQFDKARITDFATGCCAFFPSKVLKSVGFLDEKYFAYLEDADISQRIKKAGYKVLYEPSAVMWHKVSQSSGIGSELNDYFITRNRMLFGLRYADARAKIALIRESIRLLKSGRKWQKVAIRDFYKRNFGQGSWIFKEK